MGVNRLGPFWEKKRPRDVGYVLCLHLFLEAHCWLEFSKHLVSETTSCLELFGQTNFGDCRLIVFVQIFYFGDSVYHGIIFVRTVNFGDLSIG